MQDNQLQSRHYLQIFFWKIILRQTFHMDVSSTFFETKLCHVIAAIVSQ